MTRTRFLSITLFSATMAMATGAHAGFTLSTGPTPAAAPADAAKEVAKDSPKADDTKAPAKPEPVKAEPPKTADALLKQAEDLKAAGEKALMEAESRARAEKEAADSVLNRAAQVKRPPAAPAPNPPVALASAGAGSQSPATTIVAAVPIAPKPVAAPDDSSGPLFDLRRADGTLRGALKRWAALASWDSLLWQVERDFEVTAPAAFGTDFRSAVRMLLETTAGSDMEVKACFHSNMVVRVVRKSVDCKVTPHVPVLPGSK